MLNFTSFFKVFGTLGNQLRKDSSLFYVFSPQRIYVSKDIFKKGRLFNMSPQPTQNLL